METKYETITTLMPMLTKHLLPLLLCFISITSFSQTWDPVGNGCNNSSHGMLVWNGQLVNLGSYNNPCNRVSVWDGTNWSCLGNGVGIVARAGCVWNGNLVVVGDFWNVFQPCVGCKGIAMWDGTQWTALDQGFNNDVLTCTVYNGDLIIGGDFTEANGVPIARVARWNETLQQFESMGGVNDFGNDVRCMTEFNGELWVGGDFNNVGGNSPSDGVVKWDDANSVWVGGNSGVDLVGGVNESVRVLYVNPNDNNLYMGGEFPELHDGDAAAPDYNMSGIAMYDGSNWYPLGTGLNEYCRAIHEYNGNLIAGGYFTTAGGVSCNKIAKWNGVNWSPMGLGFDANGIDEYVKSAMVWNGTFFAGGAYTQAEGSPMNHIAQWYEAPTTPPTAAISGSSNATCAGTCIDFSDASTNNPTSWTWTFNGSSTPTSNAQNPGTICYPNAGNYIAQLTACNGSGCNTNSFNITVGEVPTLTVNNSSVCEGASTILTATPSVSGGDFFWTSSGETTNSISVSPTNTTTYDVEYSLNGCSSSPTSATVTVNPVPTLTVSNGSGCQGQSGILTASPSANGGYFNWISTGASTQDITVSPNTTTVYEVEYTLNGCTSASSFGTYTVYPTYQQTEAFLMCVGSSHTYPDGTTDIITGNTNHTSTLQSINGCDSIIVTAITANPNYSINTTTSVCAGSDYTYPDGTLSTNIQLAESHTSNLVTAQGCDSVITTSITVTQAPTITVNGPETICEGETVMLQTTTTSSGGDYLWSPTSETSASIVVSPTIGTHIYGVEYTLAGCPSASTSTSVTVISNPSSAILVNNNILTADLAGANYQWMDCSTNQAISGATSQSFTPANNGAYAVTIELNGCTSTSNCETISTIGLQEDLTTAITIYPNPVDDELYVDNLSLFGSTYVIWSTDGKLVQTGKTDSQGGVHLTQFPSGVYTIVFEGHTPFRFVKN